MKFSSTDKISETVSLLRNKKIYFIDRNKCIIPGIDGSDLYSNQSSRNKV